MPTNRRSCSEQVLLSKQELAVMRGLASRSEGSRLLECVLEAGHGMEHASPAALGSTWWLRWWPERRVLEAAPTCDALRHVEAEAPMTCSGPSGHEGCHSFDLESVGPLRTATVA